MGLIDKAARGTKRTVRKTTKAIERTGSKLMGRGTKRTTRSSSPKRASTRGRAGKRVTSGARRASTTSKAGKSVRRSSTTSRAGKRVRSAPKGQSRSGREVTREHTRTTFINRHDDNEEVR